MIVCLRWGGGGWQGEAVRYKDENCSLFSENLNPKKKDDVYMLQKMIPKRSKHCSEDLSKSFCQSIFVSYTWTTFCNFGLNRDNVTCQLNNQLCIGLLNSVKPILIPSRHVMKPCGFCLYELVLPACYPEHTEFQPKPYDPR